MKEIAITVKPTMACNMRCLHCFNGIKLSSDNIINVGRVLKLFDIAAKDYNLIKVTFHGGEPTLAGINFYKTIFAYQKKMKEKGILFRNFITTNGLLLNEQFIDLLYENNVVINLSFDGPYNNILRQNTDKILKNIKMIQEKKCKIRCFCTLSKHSYTHLKDIYLWFNNNCLDFKTLPIEKRGLAKENEDLIMESAELVKVFVNVYKYWIHDKKCKIRYYTFEEFSSFRRNLQFKPYWFNRKIALNPDGRIFPFGRPNDINYCLGTPDTINSIEECFYSKEYIRLRNKLKYFYEKKCKSCNSLSICNGVAICMSYMYEDDEELLEYSCKQSNAIFQNILKINDKIIDDFKKGNIEEYSDYIKEKFSEYIGE